MAFMDKEASAFFIGEEGLDLEAFFVPIAGFADQFKIGDQENGLCKTFLPPADGGHRAVSLASELDIGEADAIAGPQAQVCERERELFFVQLRILGCPADIQPVQGLDRRLELDPIEFTVSQEDHRAIFGNDLL